MKGINIPTFDEVEAKVMRQEPLDPVELFVYDYEPQPEAAEAFRERLVKVIEWFSGLGYCTCEFGPDGWREYRDETSKEGDQYIGNHSLNPGFNPMTWERLPPGSSSNGRSLLFRTRRHKSNCPCYRI